ncbi:MAG: DUF3795 domain-containing protein [Promethearchaeota archaeon]|nr:MAG: DUF3795 domain-containing protein [Candidatus Lokiarchaeota archaeon]
MEQIISRCGNLCSECPWSIYMRKKISKEDWEEYSDEVKMYTGFKPIKYEWEGCLGCLTPNKELPKHPFYNFLKKCRTRKCGNYNEVNNCAYCGRFPCANTVARDDFARERISEKIGSAIDDETYEHYIKMFDAMTNLQKIRSELHDGQIKNPKSVFKKTEIAEIKGEFTNKNYHKIYEKFIEIANSNLGIKGIDTVAGYEHYLIRKEILWRLLWIFGLYGKINENNLNIDSITLYENRKPITLLSNEEQWKIYFNILSQFGIHAELEIKTDELYTPGGYMRVKTPKTNEPAYIIKMKVDLNLQKYKFFKTLNEILSELQNKTRKRAFTNFKKLDFNSLLS